MEAHMKEKEQFLLKLNDFVKEIRDRGNQVNTFEVKEYFSNIDLTEEQMELVYDYLLAQKVVVQGYINMEATPIELTEEEKMYEEDFLGQIKAAKEQEGDFGQGMEEVLRIAKEMYDGKVFLGDLIEEGIIGFLSGGKEGIRQTIQTEIDRQLALQSQDKQIVEKVQMLDEAITELTEELGRKVTLEELAIHMGLSEEEVIAILKLAGEDVEE